MAGEKKIFILAAASLLFGSMVLSAVAADFDLSDSGEPWGPLSSPVTNFINSVSQISVDASEEGASLDLSVAWEAPKDLYERADILFSDATGGVSIREALKSLGALVVWFLEGVVALFKLGLYFLG